MEFVILILHTQMEESWIILTNSLLSRKWLHGFVTEVIN